VQVALDATLLARDAVSWARLSAFATAVPMSSVKPTMRCSVSAGKRSCRPRMPIVPHSRPSTTIGAATADRMPSRQSALSAGPQPSW
jgi:hypothetical protein